MRSWLKRLEASAARELVEIPQRDGTVRMFAPEEQARAFIAMMDGRDHPLLRAARNSADPSWARSTYGANHPSDFRGEIPDLSE